MTQKLKISAKNLNVFYGKKQALFDINLNIYANEVTSLIGPSGCGKSTLIKCFNRMNDLVDICKYSGQIMIDGQDINHPSTDPVSLRTRIGMVFQKPNPFPKSLYDNIAYGPRLHGMFNTKEDLDEIVVSSLQKAGLFNEVKDRLFEPGTGLSGGQQQRLCIARALYFEPKILILDEATNSLDKLTEKEILEEIVKFKDKTKIVMITHDPDIIKYFDETLNLNEQY